MPFRFRRSIRFAPGVRLNLGKNGLSVTVGPRGAHITVDSTVRPGRRSACRAPVFPTRRPPRHPLPCRRSPVAPRPRLGAVSSIGSSAWPVRLAWRGGLDGSEPHHGGTGRGESA